MPPFLSKSPSHIDFAQKSVDGTSCVGRTTIPAAPWFRAAISSVIRIAHNEHRGGTTRTTFDLPVWSQYLNAKMRGGKIDDLVTRSVTSPHTPSKICLSLPNPNIAILRNFHSTPGSAPTPCAYGSSRPTLWLPSYGLFLFFHEVRHVVRHDARR